MVKYEHQPSVMTMLMHVQVNQMTVTLQQLHQLRTSLSDHLEALVCPCKLYILQGIFHTRLVLLKFSV